MRNDVAMAIPERTQTFEALVALERPRVVAIAQRILRDRSAAEDVAQDVFAAFARAYDRVADRAAGWLHAAAAHAAHNALRGERRRLDRERRDFRLSGGFVEHDVASDPALLVERAEERARVRAALGRIGASHATVLALRYSGLTYAEIAAALGIGITSVGTRLARAEAALAKELHS